MGGQPESMHLVLKRTEGSISSQAVESRDIENAMPEDLYVTLPDKKGCFACNERSHNLDQCKIKHKLVSAAHQFGYATKFPFVIFEPSNEIVEKKKFYHHYILIKSNVTNLEKDILKDELNRFWKLSGDWELRRECSMTFLASFSSEGDVISCLKNPKIEILLDNKEVKLTVTRWNESGDGSLNLVEEWLLVSGVPSIYRNWKELYQVASAFGVLIDVDEESLEVGDREPIRLKTAFRSFDGAPFSYYFAFGWSSKLVMVTAVQDKIEGMKHKNKELDKEHKKELNVAKSIFVEEPKSIIEDSRSNENAKENKISAPTATITNSEITVAECSKPEGVQSIAQSPRSMIGEKKISAPADAVTKSEIKAAESSKPEGVKSISQSPRSMIGENKISAPAATVTNSEITVAESSKPEGVQSMAQSPRSMIGENKISAPAATVTNFEIIAAESSKPEGVQSIAQSPRSMIGENKISAPAATVTNSEITAAESSKPEGVQSIAQSPQSMIGEKNISAPAATVSNSEITAAESSKPEGVQSIAQSPQSMIGEKNISAPAATISNSEITAAESSKPEGMQSIAQNPQSMIGEKNINAPAAIVSNSEIKAAESSKPEGVQSIAQSQRSMIREEHLRGIQKPPIKHVYKRRGKKQQVTEAINKSPPNKTYKEVAPHTSSNATRTIGASTECDLLDQKDCSKMESKTELNMVEITPVGERKKAENFGACNDTEHNNIAASTINLKKTQILGDTSRTPKDELISKHTKGVGMDQKGSGVHKKEDASKIDTRLVPNSEKVGIYDSFSEMGLQENLLKGIYQYGLEKPSAVHQRGIVPLCKGFGVIHQSLSGTTETICTGVLQRLDYGSAECQALILVPTPNLAHKTKKVLEALGQFLGVTAQTCTGGTSAHADQQTMSRIVQVLVGTPDCILDMLQRHALSTDHIRMLFLDDADELLTGGSKDQIFKIIQNLPNKIQVGLFSATYSNAALQTSRRFMDKPVAVIVPRDELKNIKHYCLTVENEELKLQKMYALIKTLGLDFVNTQDKAVSLAQDVGKHYTISASHDGMDQHARDMAIQKFNSGSSSVLIATDHQGSNAMLRVPIVINYDLPTETMAYVRHLQQQNIEFGMSISVAIYLVVTPAERRTLVAITRLCNSSMGEIDDM